MRHLLETSSRCLYSFKIAECGELQNEKVVSLCGCSFLFRTVFLQGKELLEVERFLI